MKAVKEKNTNLHLFQTSWLHDHSLYMAALKMGRCFTIFVANERSQIHLDQQAVNIFEHQFFRGILKIGRITKMNHNCTERD